MVRPDRAHLAQTAPLEDLLSLLLRQYKRPLETQGVSLSNADAQTLANDILQQNPPSAQAEAVRTALAALVEESLGVLASWNLTFEQSLETDMDAMPGWETTAEFLEVANEKSNAEIRIAAGATLLAALGDLCLSNAVYYLATHDSEDVDSVIARRVLLFCSNVDPAAPDWPAQVRDWLDAQPTE